jgi:hypothetical protein
VVALTCDAHLAGEGDALAFWHDPGWVAALRRMADALG